MTKRIAVVLFNLGGPDCPDAVQPFLFNLFNDPAIIQMPNPFRWLLARFISARRAPVAKKIYKHLGGKSPILDLTEIQARALEKNLETAGDVKCFIAMRYWHPMILETAERVRDFQPDEIVLLPLYPQFSGTTTGSSLKEWSKASAVVGLTVPTKSICCYPTDDGWIGAQVDLITKTLSENDLGDDVRVLFSAHGLPKKIVDGGDPYQVQVERTVNAVIRNLDPDLDWAICYQSRVGRLEWIGPSTEDELKRAATDKKQVVVVPIAFVSEHSETLVELDIEYRELAEELGITGYYRVPAVGDHKKFISGLAGLVRKTLDQEKPMCSGAADGKRICDPALSGCVLKN
jgi:protoporphyrin/coproporphyrin ferrochelatase